MNAGKRGLFDQHDHNHPDHAGNTGGSWQNRSILQLAVETTLHFSSTTCRGRLVQLPTANEFDGLDFGRLTYPGRDRQQAATRLLPDFRRGRSQARRT